MMSEFNCMTYGSPLFILNSRPALLRFFVYSDTDWLIRYICLIYPICSVYGIFTNIDPKDHPNVGEYAIHGAYGYIYIYMSDFNFDMEQASGFRR